MKIGNFWVFKKTHRQHDKQVGQYNETADSKNQQKNQLQSIPTSQCLGGKKIHGNSMKLE